QHEQLTADQERQVSGARGVDLGLTACTEGVDEVLGDMAGDRHQLGSGNFSEAVDDRRSVALVLGAVTVQGAGPGYHHRQDGRRVSDPSLAVVLPQTGVTAEGGVVTAPVEERRVVGDEAPPYPRVDLDRGDGAVRGPHRRVHRVRGPG